MIDRAVRVRGVSKQFGDVAALRDVTFDVRVGEVHGLLGPNGAGKTTLLRILLGLIRADGGTIDVFGRSWDVDGQRALEGTGGFVESPRFYPYLSGRANLELLAVLDGGVEPDRIDEVLDTVALQSRARDRVGGYSFGMRQRLGLAAALLRAPRLLVLDEPANGLDPAGIRDMRALVRGFRDSGITVLLSSHDMAEVEDVCDDVTVMRSGVVAYHGSIAELRETAPDPAHRVRTTDDVVALALADAVPGIVATDLGEGVEGLAVRGAQSAVDEYVSHLVRAGVSIRELSTPQTPLEELFFQLTEKSDEVAA